MYSQAGDLVPTHRHQGQAGIEEIEIVRENKNSYYGHRTKAISKEVCAVTRKRQRERERSFTGSSQNEMK